MIDMIESVNTQLVLVYHLEKLFFFFLQKNNHRV